MAEEKQQSTCDTLYVVGKNDKGQLGLDHRANVKEITKWIADNDAIPMPTSVHNGFGFTIISADNQIGFGSLTFGFIRETCDRVPEPIMQVCVEYVVDERCFAFGNNDHGQCGVGSADETLSASAIVYFSDRGIRFAEICAHHVSLSTFWIASGHTVYGAGSNTHSQLCISNEEDQRSPTHINALDDKLSSISNLAKYTRSP